MLICLLATCPLATCSLAICPLVICPLAILNYNMGLSHVLQEKCVIFLK
ncbi:MAG: hypothetical protein OXT03_05330 [Alphaproteobacteria bacterium]|nr:hypothetical protein [Alphaproteobacteria bacterium]